MSNIFLGNNAASLTEAPEFGGYSKVIIDIDDDTSIEVGDESGRTLEFTCPWGTEQMAHDILEGLNGYSYQPYDAAGSILNPAAELGDSVTVHGVYGGIYTRETYFDDLHTSDVSAPVDEEVDHEYEYEPQEERKVKRQMSAMKAELTVQASEIAAKVSEVGGDNASFGWTLTKDGFVLSSGGKAVFTCNSDGIIVSGTIRADKGWIGGENGFKIEANKIYSNNKSTIDTAVSGVYIGTNGISLGNGAFKVDNQGNLTATSGKFTGTVYAGSIVSGTTGGYFNASGLSDGSISGSKYKDGSIGKSKLDGAIKSWLKSEGINVEATKDFCDSLTNGSGSLKVRSITMNGGAFYTRTIDGVKYVVST